MLNFVILHTTGNLIQSKLLGIIERINVTHNTHKYTHACTGSVCSSSKQVILLNSVILHTTVLVQCYNFRYHYTGQYLMLLI